MADRWMEERDRRMRERDWRRSEEFGAGHRREPPVEDRSFTGGYGRGEPRGGEVDWQGRRYGGVSPAMRQGEYGADRGRPEERFRSQGGGRGGPGYWDDLRSGGYLSSPGDYESGYQGRPQEDDRDSFMYRAGARVASWFGGDDDRPRESHRGRGPSGYRRSDERIAEDVHERLTEDHHLDATHIEVTVSGGEVTLSGTVASRHDKHHAEHIVEHLSGVTHVQNNLRVGATSSGSGHDVLDAQARGENPGTGPKGFDRDSKLS